MLNKKRASVLYKLHVEFRDELADLCLDLNRAGADKSWIAKLAVVWGLQSPWLVASRPALKKRLIVFYGPERMAEKVDTGHNRSAVFGGANHPFNARPEVRAPMLASSTG